MRGASAGDGGDYRLAHHLAIAWFAVAGLYFFAPGELPWPSVAFVLSTATAVIGSVVDRASRRAASGSSDGPSA